MINRSLSFCGTKIGIYAIERVFSQKSAKLQRYSGHGKLMLTKESWLVVDTRIRYTVFISDQTRKAPSEIDRFYSWHWKVFNLKSDEISLYICLFIWVWAISILHDVCVERESRIIQFISIGQEMFFLFSPAVVNDFRCFKVFAPTHPIHVVIDDGSCTVMRLRNDHITKSLISRFSMTENIAGVYRFVYQSRCPRMVEEESVESVKVARRTWSS